MNNPLTPSRTPKTSKDYLLLAIADANEHLEETELAKLVSDKGGLDRYYGLVESKEGDGFINYFNAHTEEYCSAFRVSSDEVGELVETEEEIKLVRLSLISMDKLCWIQ